MATDGCVQDGKSETRWPPREEFLQSSEDCVGARCGRWRVVRIEGQDWEDGDVEMGMGTSADWHIDVRLVARKGLLDLAIVHIYLMR